MFVVFNIETKRPTRLTLSSECGPNEKAFPLSKKKYVELNTNPGKLRNFSLEEMNGSPQLVTEQTWEVSSLRMAPVLPNPQADALLILEPEYLHFKCGQKYPNKASAAFLLLEDGNPLKPIGSITVAANSTRPISDLLRPAELNKGASILASAQVYIKNKLSGLTYGLERKNT